MQALAISYYGSAEYLAMKASSQRVRRERGKCEDRKSYAERVGGMELVAMVRQLHADPNGALFRVAGASQWATLATSGSAASALLSTSANENATISIFLMMIPNFRIPATTQARRWQKTTRRQKKTTSELRPVTSARPQAFRSLHVRTGFASKPAQR
jgi:hypothetical protein